MSKKATRKNFLKVLENIKKQFESCAEEDQQFWVDDLNIMLDNLRDEDFFGTEGQNDPRGDNRN